MSLAVRSAKAPYISDARAMGDPGLGSFLGGLVKGVVNIGAKAVGLPTIFPAAPGKTTSPPMLPMSLPIAQTGQAMPGTGIQVQFPKIGGVGGGGIQVGSFQPQGGGQVTPGQPTGTQLCQLPGGGTRMVRTHANRSGYWLKSGQYIAPGTKCVANRQMNPLNPRAASRAMRRIMSAKRAAKFLSRITVRSAGCGKRSCS